jgi:hypothetical protein
LLRVESSATSMELPPHKSAGLDSPDLHIGAPNRKRHLTLISRRRPRLDDI